MKELIFGTLFFVMLASTQIQAKGSSDDKIISEELVRSTTSWNGDALPTYPEGTPEVTILKFIIPSGATLPSHMHSAINAGILLSGNLVVVSEDNDVLNLKPGDTLVELVGKYHEGKNVGDEPAVIVVFYAGIEGEKFTHIADGESH